MQNKPNFKMGNINISTARTKAYAKEQRTMNNDRLHKTNPIKPNSPAPLLRRERIQNLGAKRISRFVGPASKIENPVSRIQHLPHLTTESWRYCAKQTQFRTPQNQHNPCGSKHLPQSPATPRSKKQTQTNPIPSPIVPHLSSVVRLLSSALPSRKSVEIRG